MSHEDENNVSHSGSDNTQQYDKGNNRCRDDATGQTDSTAKSDDTDTDTLGEFRRLHGLQMSKADEYNVWRQIEREVTEGMTSRESILGSGPYPRHERHLGHTASSSRASGSSPRWPKSRALSGFTAGAAVVVVAVGLYVGLHHHGLIHRNGWTGAVSNHPANSAVASANSKTAEKQWQPTGPSYLVQGMITSLNTTVQFNSQNKSYQQLQSVQFQMKQKLSTPEGPVASAPNEPFPVNSTQTIQINEPLSRQGSLNLKPYDDVEMVVREYTTGNGKLFWGAVLNSVYVQRKQVYYDVSGTPFVAQSQYWTNSNPNLHSLTITSVSPNKLVGKVPDYQSSGMKTIVIDLGSNTKIWDNGKLVSVKQAPALRAGQSVYVVAKTSGGTRKTLSAQTLYGPTTQVLGRVVQDSNHIITLQELQATTTGTYQTHPTGKTLHIQYDAKTTFGDGSTSVNVTKGDVLQCQVSGFPNGLLLAQGIDVQSTQQLHAPYTIGDLHLGEPFGKVAEQYGEPAIKTTAHGEGGLQWQYSGKGLLVDGDPVWNIMVKAPFTGSTSRGIHIGSPETAVKTAYPTAQVVNKVGTDASYAVYSPDKQVELLIQCHNGKVQLIDLQGSSPQ